MPPDAKAALRARFRRARAALTEAAYAEKSAAITERLLALPEVDEAAVVHAYWPHVRRREVDVRPLVEALHVRGVTVALPVVASFARGAPRMEHRRYDGPGCLRPNRWGLAEPAGTRAVPPEALDLVVVPAFGAGRNGHRIGHGRGYYDAFLAPLHAAPRHVPTVCPVYDTCLVEAVPAEAHDVPLHVLVTETTVLRPPRDAA